MVNPIVRCFLIVDVVVEVADVVDCRCVLIVVVVVEVADVIDVPLPCEQFVGQGICIS